MDLIKRRADTKAKRQQPSNLFHITSNERPMFPQDKEAVHRSYCQTFRSDGAGEMMAAAMSCREDRLVERNGKWLIQSSKLTV